MNAVTEFFCNNLQAIVNTVGLLLDIVGVWFVAWEVVNQFKGQKTKLSTGVVVHAEGWPVVAGQQAEDTDEYKKWEILKYWRMKVGLVLLTLGFLLQLVSNWVNKFV